MSCKQTRERADRRAANRGGGSRYDHAHGRVDDDCRASQQCAHVKLGVPTAQATGSAKSSVGQRNNEGNQSISRETSMTFAASQDYLF